MVKRIVLMAVIIMLLSGKSQAGVSVVVNGSFENDGPINPITEEDTPQKWWCDANLPSGQFGGSVSDTGWATHGDCYLALYSYDWEEFDVNDMAIISQWVELEDVNEIIFDVNLSTYWDEPWDPAKRTAVLLIENKIVWESSNEGADVRGDYFDQTYTVDPNYKVPGLQKLSLGIRANVYEFMSFVYYRVQWDFVKFDTHCGGFGYLPEDLNQDCYVNMLDLEMLAGQWLAEDPNEEYDLYRDGIVDFRDFAFFAEYWMCNTYWENWQDDNCYELGLLATDLNGDGIVNFRDFAILAKDWEPGDYDDISILADEWLLKSWLYGLE